MKVNLKSLALPLETSPCVFTLTMAKNCTYRAISVWTALLSHSACVSIRRTVSIPEPPV